MLNKLESDLRAAGWVRSPNNPHSLPGSLWYASSPDRKSLPSGQECQVLGDRIRVFGLKFFGTEYSKCSHWDTFTVAVFADATDFLAHVNRMGVVKQSLPAFSNSWD